MLRRCLRGRFTRGRRSVYQVGVRKYPSIRLESQSDNAVQDQTPYWHKTTQVKSTFPIEIKTLECFFLQEYAHMLKQIHWTSKFSTLSIRDILILFKAKFSSLGHQLPKDFRKREEEKRKLNKIKIIVFVWNNQLLFVRWVQSKQTH